MLTKKILQHNGGEPEQAAHCASYCYGTQTTDSNRVRDRPLVSQGSNYGYSCMH